VSAKGHTTKRWGELRTRRKSPTDRARLSWNSVADSVPGKHGSKRHLPVRRHRKHNASIHARFHQPDGRSLQRQRPNQHSPNRRRTERKNQHAGKPIVPGPDSERFWVTAATDHSPANRLNLRCRDGHQRTTRCLRWSDRTTDFLWKYSEPAQLHADFLAARESQPELASHDVDWSGLDQVSH